jgi:hypothetical protein
VNARLSPIVVGHAVTIIIVVCVGFLVFMIVLGVIRIRAAHQRSGDARDDEQEMAWDDSSLTITVNPLDVSSILHKPYLPLILSMFSLFIGFTISYAFIKNNILSGNPLFLLLYL